jgi:hypothetical protein
VVYDFAEFSFAIGEVRKAIEPSNLRDSVPRWVVPMSESLADLLEHLYEGPAFVQAAVQSVSWQYSSAQAASDLRAVIALAQTGGTPRRFDALHQFLGLWREAVKKTQPLPTFHPRAS